MKKILTTIVAAGVTFMFAVAPALAASTDAGAAKTDVKKTQPAATKVDAEKAKVKDADKATDVKKDTKKKTAKKKAGKKAKAAKKVEKAEKKAAGDAGTTTPATPAVPAKK